MGFFDFLKKNKIQTSTKYVASYQKNNDLINEYSNQLIKLASSDSVDTQAVKRHLAKFAIDNDMSESEVKNAELKALTLYNNVDASFVKGKDLFAPEIVDAMKYLTVVNCLNKIDTNKKIEFMRNKWNETASVLRRKMNDSNFNDLCLVADTFKLDGVIDYPAERRKLVIANNAYNITENHKLPIVKNDAVQMAYKKGEQLHYVLSTQMLKKKSKTNAITYKGFTGSVRIMKGFRYRTGVIYPKVIKDEFWDAEAYGDFWISNQRVGFLGTKAFTIPINKIFSVSFENEKLMIFKEGRQNPFIIKIYNDAAEIPLAILSELINQ